MIDAGTGLRSQQVGLPDGRTMRTVVAGSGDPLVVFEGGIAVCASMWMTVQRSVAEETRTFAYDRAGCGGSDDDPRPRSLQRMADDLAAVLAAAGLGGPAVLVGASLGAPILQLFARAHPRRVAGVVLVDAAVGEVLRVPQIRVIKTMFAVYSALSHVGRCDGRGCARSLRPFRRPTRRCSCVTSAPDVRYKWERESPRVDPASLAAAVADRHAGGSCGRTCGRAGRPRGAQGRAAMLNLFRNEMQAHPRGRFVTAADSGHHIPWQEPGLVAEETIRMVRTVRQSSANQK